MTSANALWLGDPVPSSGMNDQAGRTVLAGDSLARSAAFSSISRSVASSFPCSQARRFAAIHARLDLTHQCERHIPGIRFILLPTSFWPRLPPPLLQAVGLPRGDNLTKLFLVALLMFFFVACTMQSIAPAVTPLPIPPASTATEIHSTSTSTPKPPSLILISPNGEFVAELDNAYGHPAYEPQIIKILDKKGLLLWEIPYQHDTAMSDPHPGLTIYGWSKDSLYLYFHYYFIPDGGDRAFWWDGFDLQRINARTGVIEQVIPGDKNGFVAFAFSPDGTQIAFTRAQENPSIFYIRNLATGVQKTANVIATSTNYIRVGSIVWSPSGEKIAFQTESDDYVAQTIYLDPSDMKQKVVHEYAVDSSFFDGWSDEENLVFLDIRNGKGYIMHLNPRTGGRIEVGTSTPRP